MVITDIRQDVKNDFQYLEVGEVFEYLESFYMKIGISYGDVNAVDLMTGELDIIRQDAEVDQLEAEIIIKSKGEK